MWVVLAMGLFTHLPIRQVFRQTRCKRENEPTPARSSLCVARQRLGSEPLKQLYRRIVRPLATEQTVGGFYKGLRPVGLDGTVMEVPDHENLKLFGSVEKVLLHDFRNCVQSVSGFRDREPP